MSYSELFILFLASVSWFLLVMIIKGAYLNQCTNEHFSFARKIFHFISEPPNNYSNILKD